MNFLSTVRIDLMKTRRSAAVWLSVLGAGVIPLVFFLMYVAKPARFYGASQEMGWASHIARSWESFASFLLPMFVILICSLVLQIEYKNNTWKQVFASPLSIGQIFFSKLVSIVLMTLLLMLMFNIFDILAAIVPNLFYPKYGFLKHAIDWGALLKLNTKTFISLLGIISLQYWLSLRFRNFIVPIGIGLGLLIICMVALSWEHSDKLPYAFPLLTLMHSFEGKTSGSSFFFNHELNSIAYFLVFTLLAFLDLRFRKERG